MKKSDPIEVQTEDGRTDSVTVRELRVSEYPKALGLYDVDNESGILTLACDRPPGWADTLTPASYSAIAAAFQEVDQHFFARAVRRQAGRAVREIVVEAAGIRSAGRPGTSTSRT